MKFLYIFVAYSTLFALGFLDNARSSIYPELLREFSLSNSLGSLIFSLCSLSGFLMSLMSYTWLKRLGTLNALRLSLVCDIMACLMMGSSGPGMAGYIQFLVASVVLGVGMGCKGICVNILINYAGEEHNRRKLFSGLHTMYGIASFVAPFILGKLFAENLGWRELFIYFTLFPITVMLITLKTRPYTQVINPVNLKVKDAVKIKLIAIIFALYVSSEILISSRLTSLLVSNFNYSLSQASFYLSLFFLLLLAGRLIFSLIHIKISSLLLLKISLFSSLVVTMLGLTVHPQFLVLNGICMSFFFPSGMDWVSQEFGENSDNIIRVIMTTIGGSLVAMHYLFGLVTDLVSLSNSIWMLPGLLILSFLLLQFKLSRVN